MSWPLRNQSGTSALPSEADIRLSLPKRSANDPKPTFEPLVHRILVHQSYNDNQLLAFGRNIAQDASAIFVLACLSAICPFPGCSFQVIHNTQIVRFRARFVRGILL